jgi:hypothetical protein
MSDLEEGVTSGTGIHLVCLCVSKLCLTLVQWLMVCTMFSENVHVFQA